MKNNFYFSLIIKAMEEQKSKSFAVRSIPLRKSKMSKSRMPTVSSPTDFRHILHVGSDSHHIDISSVPPEVWIHLIYFDLFVSWNSLETIHNGLMHQMRENFLGKGGVPKLRNSGSTFCRQATTKTQRVETLVLAMRSQGYPTKLCADRA